MLYEYKSSGFDAEAKTVKRFAESHDETSMAKVGTYSTFFYAFTATSYVYHFFYFIVIDNKRYEAGQAVAYGENLIHGDAIPHKNVAYLIVG